MGSPPRGKSASRGDAACSGLAGTSLPVPPTSSQPLSPGSHFSPATTPGSVSVRSHPVPELLLPRPIHEVLNNDSNPNNNNIKRPPPRKLIIHRGIRIGKQINPEGGEKLRLTHSGFFLPNSHRGEGGNATGSWATKRAWPSVPRAVTALSVPSPPPSEVPAPRRDGRALPAAQGPAPGGAASLPGPA